MEQLILWGGGGGGGGEQLWGIFMFAGNSWKSVELPEIWISVFLKIFFINLSTDIASSATTDISSSDASRRSTISCSLSNLRFITFNLPTNSANSFVGVIRWSTTITPTKEMHAPHFH